jgi:hypothetical protein
MSSGEAYLGFARKDTVWGQNALIKVRFLPNALKLYPHSLIGYEHDNLTDKYFDNYSYKVIPDVDKPAGGQRLFIAKILKTETDLENLDKYEFLDENEIGQVYIDYINKQWISVHGLNPMYYFKDIDKYDYYVFNYNKSLTTRGKIETIKFENWNNMTIPVKLAYSLTDKYKPTTVLNAGDLQRTINVLGEIYISGLDPNFTPDMNIFKNAWFFITDENGVIIQDQMRFVEEIESDEEKLLVFEYVTITGSKARLNITTKKPTYQTISIYHESVPLPYLSTPVADNNPPGLPLPYLKETTISRSIFDVQGLSQIVKSEVSYCRQVKDEEDENELKSYGFDIETLQVVNTSTGEPVEVKFAVTQDMDMALEFNFDSVMIDKELDPTIPNDTVYRQLFVSIRPLDKDGNVCVNSSYKSDDLFQTIDDYGYNIGVLIYIANKVPVYRKYIDGKETFKIII